MTSLVFSGGSRGSAELWREDRALGAQGGGQLPPTPVPENRPHVPRWVRLERPTPEGRPGFLSRDVSQVPASSEPLDAEHQGARHTNCLP